MMKNFIFLTFCMCVAFLSTAQTLKGTIYDADSNLPLPGVHVVLSGNGGTTITDANGHFLLTKVASGKYVLTCSFVGYTSFEAPIDIESDQTIEVQLEPVVVLTDEVVVTSTRASETAPITNTVVTKEELAKQNLGQDLPILLELQPSVVTTSDAGAGIGYTGIRIRGSDASRINVTINGVPLNDPESQGVFWVNLPDLSSSVEDIQIQRGVGTSTNGAGAFGATLNVRTTGYKAEPYADFSGSVGSFNTRKYTMSAGTGLINDHFVVDARLSQIRSDGYVDRAFADLNSWFTSAAYYGKHTMVKANVFSGKERTYQAWWGVPESRLNDDQEGMQNYIINNGLDAEEAANLLSSDRRYNYYTYDNEIDNYQQDHYQLHVAQDVADGVTLNASAFRVQGQGYFEQYRKDDDLADYGLDDVIVGGDTVTSTDLIRRRWLDNDFTGVNLSFDIDAGETELVAGGSFSNYRGKHFGEVIWSRFASNGEIRHRFYDNDGEKDDVMFFGKGSFLFGDRWSVFADLQVRSVLYQVLGSDIDQRLLTIEDHMVFFNPKIGATYNLTEDTNVYGSFSIGNREPVRNDYIDAPAGRIPSPETLYDVETGIRMAGATLSYEANFYYMYYKNQLVLTGELNDVGSTIRTNVEDSYRTGIELQIATKIGPKVRLSVNGTFSVNKINEFEEVLYDYGANWDEYNEVRTVYENTDISFSPDIIGGGVLSYFPAPNVEFALLSKYVGRQFLDNTGNTSRSIDPYWRNDFRFIYTLRPNFMKEINFSLLVNNLLSERYVSNGYTYGYFGGGQEYRDNLFYAQATINFLASVAFKF